MFMIPHASFKNLAGIALCLTLFTPLTHAIPTHEPSQPIAAIPVLTSIPKATPAPPKLGARSYIVMDYNSNHTIAAANEDMKVEPASLTKIMTHYVIEYEMAAGRLKPDDLVFISPKAWREQGSRMFVQVNTQVPVHEILKGIVVQSGNDASVAMAEHIAGSEEAFSELMNQHAKRLGMENTHFVNSTGLPDPNHYTTARDMATLGKALIRDFPEGYELHAMKTYKYRNIEQRNRNKLLWRDPSVDGIKTGFTDTALYCLVSSAERNGMRLLAVVMGSKSDPIRTQESEALLNYGFRFYETHHVLKAGDQLRLSRVWMGTEMALPLGVSEDLYVTIPKGQQQLVQTQVNLPDYLEAPIQKGQPFGEVRVNINEKQLTVQLLVALKEIPQKGAFGRLSEKFKLWTYQFLNRSLNEVKE
jgi:D-alanyl-D-alanine carboxypeptidase (penicillin-binding protein 5/6)